MRPLAIDGAGGPTVITCKIAAVTVNVSDGEVTPFKLAVMWLVPMPTPVARPPAPMVATPKVSEFHSTWLVMSCWLPSE